LFSISTPTRLTSKISSNGLGEAPYAESHPEGLLIRSCFSLVPQDRLKDVLNAVSTLKEKKLKAAETLQLREQLE